MMTVSFGNLTVEELGKEMGWEFEPKDLEWLKSKRVESAQAEDIVENEGFHIFYLPLQIKVAESICDKLVSLLKKYNDKHEGDARLSVEMLSRTAERAE